MAILRASRVRPLLLSNGPPRSPTSSSPPAPPPPLGASCRDQAHVQDASFVKGSEHMTPPRSAFPRHGSDPSISLSLATLLLSCSPVFPTSSCVVEHAVSSLMDSQGKHPVFEHDEHGAFDLDKRRKGFTFAAPQYAGGEACGYYQGNVEVRSQWGKCCLFCFFWRIFRLHSPPLSFHFIA